MLSSTVKVLWWSVMLLQLYVHNGEAGEVRIAALFGTGSETLRFIIEDGVRYIQRNTSFLSEVHSISFTGVDQVKPTNSVHSALEEFCSFISGENPSAMILSEDKCQECEDIAGNASHASNPVFAVDHGSYDSGSLAFKMHPSPEDTNSFFVDMLTYYQWKNFIIVHDGGKALKFLQEVLSIQKEREWNIKAMELTSDNPSSFSDISTKIKAESTRNIFLICSAETIAKNFLVWAQENPSADILTSNYHWVLGNIDMSLDSTFRTELNRTNAYITRFGMNYTREIQFALPASITTSTNEWPLRERLAFDAVISFGHALKLYREFRESEGASGTDVLPGATQMPSCPTSSAMPAALNPLTTYLRRVVFEGISGNVEFDEVGNRVNYTISIYSGQSETFDQMRGEWTQNPAFWEKKWKKMWESEGRLNVADHNFAAESTTEAGVTEADFNGAPHVAIQLALCFCAFLTVFMSY